MNTFLCKLAKDIHIKTFYKTVATLIFRVVIFYMQINSYNNRINYTSKIRVVTSNEFNKHLFDEYIYCGSQGSPIKDSMSKVRGFWTPSVRTCSAGGVVGNDGVLGFHFYDCLENMEKLQHRFKTMITDMIFKPKSAFIIGGKKLEERPASVPLFDIVADEVGQTVKPSIFKTHKHKFGESDIGYEKCSDTWFINSVYPKNPMLSNNDVELLSVDDLKQGFESIKIAPQDDLFIMDKKITRDICPEFFE